MSITITDVESYLEDKNYVISHIKNVKNFIRIDKPDLETWQDQWKWYNSIILLTYGDKLIIGELLDSYVFGNTTNIQIYHYRTWPLDHRIYGRILKFINNQIIIDGISSEWWSYRNEWDPIGGCKCPRERIYKRN